MSLGTSTNRHSQIRIPTCSGQPHYFSLLNSQVTQEQGVSPGLTFRTKFLLWDRHQREAARSPGEPLRCSVLTPKHSTWALYPLTGHRSFRLKQGCPGVAALLASLGHCFLPATHKPRAICTLPGAEQLASPPPLTSSW